MLMDSAALSNPIPVVESHLRAFASRYFPELDSARVEVQLVARRVRPASQLCRYRVHAGAQERWVLVKMPPPGRATQDSSTARHPARKAADRPRLTDIADAEVKHLLEYKALVDIHCYFSRLANRRFGAVRPLNYLPERAALLMEELQMPSLRDLFSKINLLRGPLALLDLHEVFYNAGAWLRYYHALPKENDVPVRNAARRDYTDSIAAYVDYLGPRLGDEKRFQAVGARAIACAEKVLPEQLPLGLGHGDYAMRNILVGDQSRVTVIDTLSRWRVPIYEDIAHFLVKLQANQLQVYTLGSAISARRVAAYETEFLNGYFGAETPLEAVRLFALQALLDHWAAQVATHNRHGGNLSWTKKLRLNMVNGFYSRLLTHYEQRQDGCQAPAR